MTWNNFVWFALPSAFLWLTAGGMVYRKNAEKWSNLLMVCGTAFFATFIVGFWVA